MATSVAACVSTSIVYDSLTYIPPRFTSIVATWGGTPFPVPTFVCTHRAHEDQQTSSGTFHFVVTDNGKRIDFLFSALTNSTGSLGDFSLSGTDLRQTRPEF